MVYLFFALYAEAKPFLEKWKLKKQNQYTKYQVFEGERICCMIMGVGAMKTAIHITNFLSSRKLQKEDIFVNIGFAGSKNREKKKGELYFIHKIHTHESGRDFYPEVLYQQKFSESSLESCSKRITNREELQEELVDMEGAAFFETLSFFGKKRQIFLYKCVSDFLETGNIRAENLLEPYVEELGAFFLSLSEKLQQEEDTHLEELYSLLAEHFHCSTTMEIQLREYLHYAKCKKMDIKALLQEYLQIEISSKGEGKQYVEELRRKILEF